MIRKLMVVSAMLVGLVAASTVAPASAAGPVDYAGCVISLDPTVVLPGGAVQVTGSGFQPAFDTHLIFDRALPTQADIGTVHTSATGTFVTSVNIPLSALPGFHSISADCSSNPAAGFASALLAVVPSIVSGGGGGGTTGGTTGGGPVTTAAPTTLAPAAGTNARLILSESVVTRLQQFTATVTGANPGSSVEFAQFSTRTVVGSAIADASGVAVLKMSFPATAALGDHQVEARGTDTLGGAFILQAPIKVVAAKTSGFPITGTNAGPMAFAGLGAVALGSVLVAASRRRRQTPSSS